MNEMLSIYPKSKKLIERWDNRLNLVQEVTGQEMSIERKMLLAQTLENTQQAITMMETTQAADVGPYKKFALDLVTAIIPNVISYDLVSVQPIDNKIGMINYLRYLYGSRKGDIAEGTEFSSSLAYTSNVTNYSSEVVNNEVIGNHGLTSYTGNLAYVPVRPGTVRVTAGVVNVVDNGQGGFTGAGINTVTSTINYATGAFTIVFNLATTESPSVDYEFNLEHVPSTIPQVDIKIESLPVIARSRKLRALYAFDSAFDLRKSYGSDIDSLLSSQIAAEIAHEIDAEIMNDLLVQAGAGATQLWNRIPPHPELSLLDHYETFFATLIEGSNTIFGATRRATGNFLVVGLTAASVVESMRGFKPEPVSAVGPHKIGTLGNFTVYKNPFYANDAYLIGYRGSSYFDAGYFYCPYMPIVTTDLVMLDDFIGRRGWATSYAKKMVNNKLYLAGRVTNIPPVPIP